MRKDLLLKLADLLEADAVNPEGIKFDLTLWGQIPPGYQPGDKIGANCSTMGCAFGLAAISGIFEAEGLRYRALKHGSQELVPYLDVPGTPTSFDAAAELFNITPREAQYLFDPSFYLGPKTGATGELKVAAKIKQSVDAGRIRMFLPEDENK